MPCGARCAAWQINGFGADVCFNLAGVSSQSAARRRVKTRLV
jgi:hypothetical protein